MEKIGFRNTSILAVILGAFYCLFIYIENTFAFKSPIQFTTTKTLFYIAILIGLLLIGFRRRKELGGYISFKEALQAILISIVIVEVIYAIFNVIYIKYIDPTFIAKLKNSWFIYFHSTQMDPRKIDEIMVNFDEQQKVRLTFKSIFGSVGIAIVLDSIAGLLMALAIKKEKHFAE
jgi:hypothetical protein